MSDFLINAGLWLTYIMVAGGALAAIAFPVMFLAKNPEKAKGALKGIGGLIAVVVISFSFLRNSLLANSFTKLLNFVEFFIEFIIP